MIPLVYSPIGSSNLADGVHNCQHGNQQLSRERSQPAYGAQSFQQVSLARGKRFQIFRPQPRRQAELEVNIADGWDPIIGDAPRRREKTLIDIRQPFVEIACDDEVLIFQARLARKLFAVGWGDISIIQEQ